MKVYEKLPMHTTNKRNFLVLFLLLALHFSLHSQSKEDSILNQFKLIKRDLRTGDLAALDKLLEYFDDTTEVSDNLGYHRLRSTVDHIARRTFQDYFIFDSLAQLVLLNNRPEGFKRLYETKRDKLRFSKDILSFLWTPLENRQVVHRLLAVDTSAEDSPDVFIKEQCAQMQKDLGNKFYKDALKHIDLIAGLRHSASETFLYSCFDESFYNTYKFPDRAEVYKTAAYGFRLYPGFKNINFLLNLCSEKKVPSSDVRYALEVMTAVPCRELMIEKDPTCEELSKCLSSFKSLEAMQEVAFEKRLGIRKHNGNSASDFFSHALFMTDYRDAILYTHALHALAATHEPVSLKYLGSLVLRQRVRWNEYYNEEDKYNDPVKVLEKLTGTRVQVLDYKGRYTFEYEGIESRENYGIYWSTHYQDYAWDARKQRFVNTKETVAIQDSAYYYLKQLNSERDFVAGKAYLALSELNAQRVSEAVTSERELIDQAHSKHFAVLPMFPERRLPAQSKLFEFCKRNNVHYKPEEGLKRRLDSLTNKQPEADLYKMENRLISTLQLDELTAVEWWASIGGEDATYSIGRILDKCYSKYFNSIINNEKQLRLFLKKAAVYDEFGIIGVCNKYLWKFENCDETTLQTLKDLLITEKDLDIIRAVNSVIKKDYWRSTCDGTVSPLYDSPLNLADTLEKLNHVTHEKKLDAYYSLQFNDYFIDAVANGSLTAEMLKPIIKGLEQFAGQNKDSDFEYTTSSASALWLKNQHLSFSQQLAKAHKAADKEICEEVINAIVLQMNYKDLPLLVKEFSSGADYMDKWFIQSHVKQDLVIPVNLENKKERDTLLSRYARSSEKQFYTSYLHDFGLQAIFTEADSLNYALIYETLEYDVVDAFVGGGGGRRSASALLAIRLLELHFNTYLGFHWRKEYISDGIVYNLPERSCAWMKFLKDKKLVTVSRHQPSSFSN